VISTTAKQVGGDYATLKRMDDGTAYLAVCDAMGKGMSASYFSLMSHVAFHSVVEQQHASGITPGGILTLMNRIMSNDFDVFGMFTTAIIAKIEPGSDRLLYASAGHCPPVIHTPDGETATLDTVDFMLGVERDTEYKDLSADFPVGTRVLFYSDGLTDVMERGSDETLGILPLLHACGESFGGNDIKTACERVFEAILRCVGGKFDDDVSIIGVERTDD
jgi:sigma-B regulation protein RsbU (phosphoserine phosphatase)